MTKIIISNLVQQIHYKLFTQSPRLKTIGLWLVGLFMMVLVLSGVVLVSYYLHYQQLIFPGVSVGPVLVGGLTKAQAHEELNRAVDSYKSLWPQTFADGANRITLALPDDSVTYDLNKSVDRAFALGKIKSISGILELLKVVQQPQTVPLEVAINPVWLDTTIASISAQVDVSTIPPQLEIQTDARGKQTAKALMGQNGRLLNQAAFKDMVETSLRSLTPPISTLEMKIEPVSVSEQDMSNAETRANALLATKLTLLLNDEHLPQLQWVLEGTDLAKFVKFSGGYEERLITEYLSGVAQAVNRPPKDAKFEFDATVNKVKEFVPAEDGIEVAIDETSKSIIPALEKLASSQPVDPVAVTVKRTAPDVSLSEVNRLGIKELIGVGRSTYKGSIASRVHNVALGAARIHGTLVKPGEEFSFNAAIGEISAATGYQAAYVIKNGRTELGDGGGVCQDSTTVFRAALDAGLPIVYRKGHAYRVGYYEQDTKPGVDATVYSPSTDFKFLNDTPAHILIQTEVDTPNRALTVYIYGTSDGRKATIKDHVVWDITPPPPDVYVDDPTLPMGTVKQVDWKAGGAKARFSYVVEREGQTIYEKTFVTNYQPWAAVFLRGTKQ